MTEILHMQTFSLYERLLIEYVPKNNALSKLCDVTTVNESLYGTTNKDSTCVHNGVKKSEERVAIP